MLKVLWPMEPVEPRSAIFFTDFILLGCEGIYWGEVGGVSKNSGESGSVGWGQG